VHNVDKVLGCGGECVERVENLVVDVDVVVDQEYSDYGGGGMLLLQRASCCCSAVSNSAAPMPAMHTLT